MHLHILLKSILFILYLYLLNTLCKTSLFETDTHKDAGFQKRNEQHKMICLFDLILYVPSTIFQLNRDGSSWVEPVLS